MSQRMLIVERALQSAQEARELARVARADHVVTVGEMSRVEEALDAVIGQIQQAVYVARLGHALDRGATDPRVVPVIAERLRQSAEALF